MKLLRALKLLELRRIFVPNMPEWEKMFIELGYSLACNPEDPDSIAKAFHWFLEHPEKNAGHGREWAPKDSFRMELREAIRPGFKSYGNNKWLLRKTKN